VIVVGRKHIELGKKQKKNLFNLKLDIFTEMLRFEMIILYVEKHNLKHTAIVILFLLNFFHSKRNFLSILPYFRTNISFSSFLFICLSSF
jgi:hypothetical protein